MDHPTRVPRGDGAARSDRGRRQPVVRRDGDAGAILVLLWPGLAPLLRCSVAPLLRCSVARAVVSPSRTPPFKHCSGALSHAHVLHLLLPPPPPLSLPRSLGLPSVSRPLGLSLSLSIPAGEDSQGDQADEGADVLLYWLQTVWRPKILRSFWAPLTSSALPFPQFCGYVRHSKPYVNRALFRPSPATRTTMTTTTRRRLKSRKRWRSGRTRVGSFRWRRRRTRSCTSRFTATLHYFGTISPEFLSSHHPARAV